MPCYTTTTVTLNENTNWNLERAHRAALQAKMRAELLNGSLNIIDSLNGATISIKNGKITINARSQSQIEAARKKLNQIYATETIKDASKRFGWRITNQSQTTTGLTQLTLNR